MPNPFNPSSQISYALPEASDVQLVIYDMLGRQVRVLVNTHQVAGRYTVVWDGRNQLGEAVSSGVYLYRIYAGSFAETKKMTLMK